MMSRKYSNEDVNLYNKEIIKSIIDDDVELYNIEIVKSIIDYDRIKSSPFFLFDYNLISELITVFDNDNDEDEFFAILTLMHTDYVSRGGDPYTWYKLTTEKFAIALSNQETKQTFWDYVIDILLFEVHQLNLNKKDGRRVKECAYEINEKMENGVYHNPFIDGKKVNTTIQIIMMRDYPNIKFSSLRTELYKIVNFR